MIEDIDGRVQAMALVHQLLYSSQNLSHLNLRDYLSRLARLLQDSYSREGKRISLSVTSPDRHVLIDFAIPLGQIVTELVSNSVKHAFPGGRDGRVTIEVCQTDSESIVLDYRDDGVGFPEDFDIRRDSNLGLETVRLMVEDQLGGSITLSVGPGAVIHIELTENNYQKRV